MTNSFHIPAKLKKAGILTLFFIPVALFCQNSLAPQDFLGLVRQNHPVAKQANLIPETARARLLQARGAFDPKLTGDFQNKTYKETEYYSQVYAALKVPSWYGIELKADYSYARGSYINPKDNLPEQGLMGAGLSMSLGRGLWIDQRRAVLRQARIFQQASEAERLIALNDLLFDASQRYTDWALAEQQRLVLDEAARLSAQRLSWVRQSFAVGDEPAIDTVEATIQLQNVNMLLRDAVLAIQKARLELETFLWDEDGKPLELREETLPAGLNVEAIGPVPGPATFDSLQTQINNLHPDLLTYRYKLATIEIDRRLAAEQLKPTLNFNYQFLNENIVRGDGIGGFYVPFENNYKWGIDLSFSLFLRKERGKLQEVTIKQEQTQLARDLKRQELLNKLEAYYLELQNMQGQLAIAQAAVNNYQRMLEAEEMKFRMGESSVFLINSRQNKLIDAQLKLIALRGKVFKARAGLAWASGVFY
ncbi:MAG: TolC family protein [Bacteroidia bacterium]